MARPAAEPGIPARLPGTQIEARAPIPMAGTPRRDGAGDLVRLLNPTSLIEGAPLGFKSDDISARIGPQGLAVPPPAPSSALSTPGGAIPTLASIPAPAELATAPDRHAARADAPTSNASAFGERPVTAPAPLAPGVSEKPSIARAQGASEKPSLTTVQTSAPVTGSGAGQPAPRAEPAQAPSRQGASATTVHALGPATASAQQPRSVPTGDPGSLAAFKLAMSQMTGTMTETQAAAPASPVSATPSPVVARPGLGPVAQPSPVPPAPMAGAAAAVFAKEMARDLANEAGGTDPISAGAPSSRSGAEAPSPVQTVTQQPARGEPPMVPYPQLAAEIARNARAGKTSFDIRLDPPELGRVRVKLDVGADGEVRAHLIVERRDTLDFLQRDARVLERALDQAGFKTDQNSLQFSMSQNGDGRMPSPGGRGGPHADTPPATSPDAQAPADAPIARHDGLLDIRI